MARVTRMTRTVARMARWLADLADPLSRLLTRKVYTLNIKKDTNTLKLQQAAVLLFFSFADIIIFCNVLLLY